MRKHDAFCALPEYHHGECSATRWDEDWAAARRSMLTEAVGKAVALGADTALDGFTAQHGLDGRWRVTWVDGKGDRLLASPPCLTEGGVGRDVALHGGADSALGWELYSRQPNRIWTAEDLP